MLTDEFYFLSGVTVDGPDTTDPGCTLVVSDLEGEIAAEVAVDGYEKGFGDRGPWRRIMYKVPWDQSDRFIDIMKGGVTGVSGGLIAFPTPHRYPGNTRLVCTNARAVPHGPGRFDATKLFAADAAWVTCDYEVPVLDVYGEQFQTAMDGEQIPWSSLSEQGAEEMLAADASLFRYRAVGGSPSYGSVGIPVAGNVIQLRRGMIPNDLYSGFLDLLQALAGKLNNAPIFGRATGTLRLENWSRDWRIDASGSVVWEFAINLRWRQVDHNAEIVEGTLDTWAILEDTGSRTRFGYANFNPLKRYGVAV